MAKQRDQEHYAAQRARFLEILSDTGRISEAREQADISYYLLTEWRRTIPEFDAQINSCQEAQIEKLFDRLDSVLEDYPNPQAAKVASDNIRWKLAKLKPERYGDRIDVKSTLTIDLTDRFQAAVDRLSTERLRPDSDLPTVIEGESRRIEPTPALNAPDIETDDSAELADRPASPRADSEHDEQ